MREAAAGALGMYKGRIEETLPESIMAEYSLMPRGDALLAMHMPQSFEQLERAKERMAFEDMLLYALMLSILRYRREQGGGIAFNMKGKLESFKNCCRLSLRRPSLGQCGIFHRTWLKTFK